MIFCKSARCSFEADSTPSLVRPPRPPIASYSLIALLPLEAGQTMYRARRKPVVVRAWPRANAIPDRSLAHFDAWALSQLRLLKSFCAVKELSTIHVFDEHFTAGGFPHLRHAQQDMDADSDTDSEPDFGMMDNATVDSRVRQDDDQQPKISGRAGDDITPLMGSREFDVVYVWLNSRHGVGFNALLRCLPATNASTVILPRLPCPLSVMQRMVKGVGASERGKWTSGSHSEWR